MSGSNEGVAGPRQAAPARLEDYHGDEETGHRAYPGRVSLRYGGHTIRYVADRPGLDFHVRGPRMAFVVSAEAPADVEVRCAVGAVGCSRGEPAFRAMDAWEARALPDGTTEICYLGHDETGQRRRPWARLRHDTDLARAEFLLAPREYPGLMDVGFPTDEYLMARRLARTGGVILHASAVALDGAAYLFIGHSGAGKSTTAMHALSLGAEVLSDDRTIVTIERDGGVRAWGTPWHGSLRKATNMSAPVRGLFVIVQADEESVVPIVPARVVGEAFVRLVHPTPEAWEVNATLETLERVAAHVPAGELRQRASPAGFRLAMQFAAMESRGRTR
jgi:hypothetical protein